MKPVLAVAVLAVMSAFAGADEVYLKGGGRLVGVVLERTSAGLLLEVGPGHVTVPLSRIERVVSGRAPLAVFRERASRLAGNDVEGWLALAAWAQDRDLGTQAQEAYRHVLSVDPRNATAHDALGHVLLMDRWVSPEESYRARGYVPFEGGWVQPEERAAILRERADEAASERARIEADARAREAEARARTAEAEARRAESEARQAEAGPLVPGYGYGPFVGFPGIITVPSCPRPGGFVVVQTPGSKRSERRARDGHRPRR